MDIQSYMVTVGKQARAASRLVAKADTATKNRALTLTAEAIERDAARLLTANALDLDAARAKKLDAPLIDRLTLTKKSIADMSAIAANPVPATRYRDERPGAQSDRQCS